MSLTQTHADQNLTFFYLFSSSRYMAEELLNATQCRPSADMFSLGLTLYELCCYFAECPAGGNGLRFTPRHGLPENGSLWHTLREDAAPAIPAERPAVLWEVVKGCMRREAALRPSALQVLSVEQVRNTLEDVDPVLLCAPRPADSYSRAPALARSASLQAMEGGLPPLAGPGGTGTGIVGSSSVPSQGLSIAVGQDNQIDYAALGDGAFTPNFPNYSYGNFSPRG